MPRDAYQRRLYRSSGQVKSTDPLVCFLYLVLRDLAPAGKVAEMQLQARACSRRDPHTFTNGHLARYAMHLARRLRRRAC